MWYKGLKLSLSVYSGYFPGSIYMYRICRGRKGFHNDPFYLIYDYVLNSNRNEISWRI